ncbi:MAG: hypothetical protein JST94_01800 [Bacteroidetes bacterium]|nr:hypothetical protein [Bacteroidota bacterium]MBS1670182.1 hypothetical protein [Bacteroidota bacterium]
MKKIFILLIIIVPVTLFSQNEKQTRQEKIAQRKERINKLIKQEEEGALIYEKQSAFGIKLNTDGYGLFYEHGKYKTIEKTNSWFIELGERKDKKEEKITNGNGFFAFGNPYIYGKINNFYYLKLGIEQQRLLGGKGNKNGVAVSLIYGGGLSLGMLKPYYLQISSSSLPTTDIKYDGGNDATFLNQSVIDGSSSPFKGFGEIKYVPGALLKTAIRFDYGRYNELLSAIEVGVNAEYYSDNMPIMAKIEAGKFFFNAYLAFVFGKRK